MYRPKYSITNKILMGIASIEASREFIEHAPLVPYWERQFREDAAVRIAHHTTALEGNPLSIDEARAIWTGGESSVRAHSSHVQEVINYRSVIKYIEGLKIISERITEEHLNKIHEMVVQGVVSEEEQRGYRSGWYGTRNSVTGEVSFVAPKPEDVIDLVQAFFEWVESAEGIEAHPILRAGIIIAEVARIHPFTEGNGRTARALGTASLYLDGYDIKRFFSLDEYYDQNASGYYDAIQTYKSDTDSLNAWLEFFVEGLSIELGRIKDRVLKLSKDQQLRQEIGQVSLNDRQEEILTYIEKNGAFRNSDFEELFPNISEDTVLRELKDLMDKGILKKEGKTKAARYIVR
ncbi:hypothetical protein CO180_00025 [candidate division WWE3 bacterium CG_4_9_14_3_um_filter_41_6]|uniref:Fido domain-containing protein n=1 Tax=candidate division WWE3 bacterium CG_4_10_14_0_2_um_filter_41_14 TaxID=1975072 RepID=A0A2M7TI52_UNCKA|nr:MAG: hypothetical protein COY32_04175 [candidate division WWE3 bacterium CG_4_10_14_0_2_um_filter_41_14]PJA39733.1 MAG: hypothetical protein CO180_00025 [candidate division WWE3 bacterium CG_4_9_14_3_um_filter_41_6]